MSSTGPIALGAALTSTSYFLFGNLGAAYFGIMPLIERGKTNLPVVDRLALWKAFYDTAMRHMASSSAASSVSLAVAASTVPASPLRSVMASGCAASLIVGVVTMIWLMPVNNNLAATLKATSVNEPMSSMEQERVLEKLDTWRKWHRVRMSLGAVAWVATVTAIMATDKVFALW
ncbi:hypothetical protein B0H15DRAFT_1019643 [Mycena belliarum]|uniref:DUF1772-domain-containing protein n=1 Tax=Mycena belliarum TaxID=1033014 RepID=A0AAD6UBY0_9AGAR|nr:hypothetical protein B0H15DRAFT_1019643 [Mycena belliae]